MKATGKEDSDDWVGEKVTLYSTEVQFGREMVEAIRIRVTKGTGPSKPAAVDPNDDVPF